MAAVWTARSPSGRTATTGTVLAGSGLVVGGTQVARRGHVRHGGAFEPLEPLERLLKSRREVLLRRGAFRILATASGLDEVTAVTLLRRN